MRKFKTWRGGGAYVWWLTHRHEARTAALFLILSVLCVGYYEFNLAVGNDERVALARVLSEERAARGLPNTVFVLEAATVANAQEKLARIAGELDVARYEMGKKK